MAKFHVTYTFEISDSKPRFVLAGSIIEGEIRSGMLVHVSGNSAFATTAPIHAIEFARRIGGYEDVCLVLQLEPELLDIWRGLNIKDETLEITANGSA